MDSAFWNSLYPLRIEVCGGIASGKTTFATLLKHIGIKTILETFRANPFWKSFYVNPAKYAFETELTFLLQHYHQIKVAITEGKTFVCDFSPLLDLAYANVTLHGSKHETFLSVYNEVRQDLGLPDLLVHLCCGAAAELERIRKRGRTIEESITLEYLGKLNDSVERQVAKVHKKTKVISIDSEHRNFATDKIVQRELVDLILQHMPENR